MSEQVKEQPKREDRIRISEEVIATIAGIAAARDMQKRVRDAVEDMTGLEVVNVNVNVLGINISKDAGKVEVIDELPPRA